MKTDYKQAVKVYAVRQTTARLFVFVPSIYAPGSSEDDLSTLNSIQVSLAKFYKLYMDFLLANKWANIYVSRPRRPYW